MSGMPDVMAGGMHKVGKEISGMPRVMDHMSKIISRIAEISPGGSGIFENSGMRNFC